jgi:hypothetical protein
MVQTSPDAWDSADENVVEPTGPRYDDLFHAYLDWYEPRTYCRIIHASTHPQRHQASSEDTYARHRDEALAGTVSDFYACL